MSGSDECGGSSVEICSDSSDTPLLDRMAAPPVNGTAQPSRNVESARAAVRRRAENGRKNRTSSESSSSSEIGSRAASSHPQAAVKHTSQPALGRGSGKRRRESDEEKPGRLKNILY